MWIWLVSVFLFTALVAGFAAWLGFDTKHVWVIGGGVVFILFICTAAEYFFNKWDD